MNDWTPTRDDVGTIYAAFWRIVDLCVHRYGSVPSGHMLVAFTIILLDRTDYHPTVGELADLTRLPKSTVSRYVATDMNAGLLKEVIDPDDRRRRHIHPTRKAKEEQQWLEDNTRIVSKLSARALRGEGASENPAEDLKRILLDMGQKN